ncbi:MAG: winged helix-turn-helix domain-containing protein [Planctomycetota bacterium]|nr:winged helix-turn-helix domain-containing protein [Planctomycetota bacterium]
MLTRNQLIDLVRGVDVFVIDRTIDVHLCSLRRKLGSYGDIIETVRGVGYRLKE